MQNKVSWLFLTFPSHKHWVIDYWMWLCCCNQVLWEACWRLSLSLLLSTFQEQCLLPAWTLCDLSLARCLSCPVSDIMFLLLPLKYPGAVAALFPSTSLPFFVFWCKLALEWVNSLCCGEKVSLWRLRRAVPWEYLLGILLMSGTRMSSFCQDCGAPSGLSWIHPSSSSLLMLF